jgi:hypothetical protein
MTDLEPREDGLQRRIRAYVARLDRDAPPADFEDRIVRRVFSGGRGKWLTVAAASSALVIVCAAVFVVALAVHGGSQPGASTSGGTSTGRQSITVLSESPEVAVQLWPGGPVYDVDPGETRVLSASGAPPQPWKVTVTSEVTDQVILRQDVSADQEIVVSMSGVRVTALQAPQTLAATPGQFCGGTAVFGLQAAASIDLGDLQVLGNPSVIPVTLQVGQVLFIGANDCALYTLTPATDLAPILEQEATPSVYSYDSLAVLYRAATPGSVAISIDCASGYVCNDTPLTIDVSVL